MVGVKNYQPRRMYVKILLSSFANERIDNNNIFENIL